MSQEKIKFSYGDSDTFNSETNSPSTVPGNVYFVEDSDNDGYGAIYFDIGKENDDNTTSSKRLLMTGTHALTSDAVAQDAIETNESKELPILLASDSEVSTGTPLFDSDVKLNTATDTITANATGSMKMVKNTNGTVSNLSAGGINQPVYFNENGIPTEITGPIGSTTNPIYVNDNGELTASTKTVGSSTTGVYLDNGKISPTTTAVDEGTSGKLAYYKNSTEIDDYNATIGTTTSPVYFNNGVPTEIPGVLDIKHIPEAALERVVIVDDSAARLALTTASVQLGDVVKETDTGLMYFVKDETKLNSEAGYELFVAGSAAKATADGSGNTITSTYVKSLSLGEDGNTITYTKGDNTESSFTVLDNKVKVENNNTTKAYLTGSTTVSGDANTLITDSGIYLDTANRSLTIGNRISDSIVGEGSFAQGIGVIASGEYSHAEGYSTKASGEYSHAEGYSTKASGDYSHSEGYSTTAFGDYSHAEGNATAAFGYASHSEGYSTTASGDYSHAEGHNTVVTGENSHAEGYLTVAEGKSSHVEGEGAIAGGNNSHAEGYGTEASGLSSHAEGNSTIASGASSHAEGQQSYTGIKTTDDDGNVTYSGGQAAHAEGYLTVAEGKSSHAEGEGAIAGGNNSHAEGYGTEASGLSSHAEGNSTIASGASSHAEGSGTTADEQNSHAEGSSTIAYGQSSHAEGSSTVASGYASHTEGQDTYTGIKSTDDYGNVTYTEARAAHAEGYQTNASGNYSHSEGYKTIARGLSAHAEGEETLIYGRASHSEGKGGIAYGDYSHAEGHGTTTGRLETTEDEGSIPADGYAAHAEGESTKAEEDYSHAEGYITKASGIASHAQNYYTIADQSYQTAIGKYNTSGNTDNLFAIGNGTNSTDRSDAFTVNTSGHTVTNSFELVDGDTTYLKACKNEDLEEQSFNIVEYINPGYKYINVDGNTVTFEIPDLDIINMHDLALHVNATVNDTEYTTDEPYYIAYDGPIDLLSSFSGQISGYCVLYDGDLVSEQYKINYQFDGTSILTITVTALSSTVTDMIIHYDSSTQTKLTWYHDEQYDCTFMDNDVIEISPIEIKMLANQLGLIGANIKSFTDNIVIRHHYSDPIRINSNFLFDSLSRIHVTLYDYDNSSECSYIFDAAVSTNNYNTKLTENQVNGPLCGNSPGVVRNMGCSYTINYVEHYVYLDFSSLQGSDLTPSDIESCDTIEVKLTGVYTETAYSADI